MGLRIETDNGEFVAKVHGLKVTGGLSPKIADQLREALDRHLVLIIPGAEVADEDFVAFGASFGVTEDFNLPGRANTSSINITNLDPAGQTPYAAAAPHRYLIAADALWHTDSSYRPYRARYSMLVARTLPKVGGETQFADTRAAYEALPEATQRRLDGLFAHHTLLQSRTLVGYDGWTEAQRAALAPVRQPMVLQNPNTGRRSIYLASHICEIEGLSAAETRALVTELTDFATQRRFTHLHRWSVGDIAIWDDRATMHRRMPYDDLTQPRALTSVRVVDLPELQERFPRPVSAWPQDARRL